MEEKSQPTCSAADLLTRVREFILRFVVISEEEVTLLAAWVLHGYVLGAAEYTPYVHITSATQGCGKSRLLDVLGMLVKDPLPSANISTASLYRVLQLDQERTMLLDELNQRGRMDEDMRTILNSGFARGFPVIRCVGNDNHTEEFPVFCPKALAGIGQLDSTIVDRSFSVRMKRKLATDGDVRFRRREYQAVADAIKSDIEAWADAAIDDLIGAVPKLPDALDDRACDVFEPLFAIADNAGGGWPERVRAAAIANRATANDERLDPAMELLRDLREIWAGNTKGFVPTREVISNLVADTELRWATYGRGNAPLSERALATLLKRFGVESVRDVGRNKHAPNGGRQCRGYRREDLQEHFDRYLGAPAGDSEAGVESASNGSTK